MKKNYIYNLLFQILTIVLPLVTVPYLSRVLGSNNIGIYAYTLSIVTYFIIGGTLGVSMYGQREIAYLKNDKEKRSKKFFELLLLKFISMFISIILFIFLFGISGKYSNYYLIYIFLLLSNALDISWYYQGVEQFKSVVLKNSLIKIIGVFNIFIFVKSSNDLWIYILLYVLFEFLGNISLYINLKNQIDFSQIKNISIFSNLKPVIILMIPQLAIQIYNIIDRTMIGNILNNMSEVGYYDQSQKIIRACIMVVTASSAVVTSRVSHYSSEHKEDKIKECLKSSYSISMFLSFGMLFGFLGLSKVFVPVYFGPGFESVTYLLYIFSLLLVFIAISNIFGMQYLIPVKKQNIVTISVVVASILNIIMNYIFIPIWGGIGAAIASVVAELIVILIQFTYVKKLISVIDLIKWSYKYFICSFIMLICIIFILSIIKNSIIAIIVSVIIGGGLYVILLLIFKDAMICHEFNNLIKIKNIILYNKGREVK